MQNKKTAKWLLGILKRKFGISSSRIVYTLIVWWYTNPYGLDKKTGLSPYKTTLFIAHYNTNVGVADT